MGRTVPTITNQLLQVEGSLSGFRRLLRKSDQYLLDGLFAQARLHTAAIGACDELLPFEAALLAMLLEQARQIACLEHELAVLKAQRE